MVEIKKITEVEKYSGGAISRDRIYTVTDGERMNTVIVSVNRYNMGKYDNGWTEDLYVSPADGYTVLIRNYVQYSDLNKTEEEKIINAIRSNHLIR